MALERVLQNIVENALKYGGEAMKQFEIGYKEDGAFHIISIQDDGIGIKPCDSEQIFGLFQRNEASRGKSGSGLGLAIVKEIMTKHRGNAWVDNSADRGAKLCVSIPKDLDIDMA